MARVVSDGAVGACGIALAAVGFLGSERWGQHGRRRAMGAARTSADGSSAVWDNAKAAEGGRSFSCCTPIAVTVGISRAHSRSQSLTFVSSIAWFLTLSRGVLA